MIGPAIKAARRVRGLTLAELGNALGVTRQYVQAWEAGRRNPSRKYLRALAEVLGLQVTDLLPQPNHNRPASAGHGAQNEAKKMVAPIFHRNHNRVG
jgi:transcriptional regulator with XRE-family HTH domain